MCKKRGAIQREMRHQLMKAFDLSEDDATYIVDSISDRDFSSETWTQIWEAVAVDYAQGEQTCDRFLILILQYLELADATPDGE